MISFVIPAFNEEAMIGRTIDAVHAAARAAGETYEIVVADDGSTDRTAEIARERGARVVPVRHRQISATRNSGARAAEGDALIFVDADTLVNGELLGATVAALRAGAVGGGCVVDFDGRLPLYSRLMLLVLGPAYRAFGLAAGCFVFCSRQAFHDTGGFDESLFAGEEVYFSRALARRGRFVILKERVLTSGRKLRTHSMLEVLGTLLRAALSCGRIARRRQALDLWYGERRSDPGESRPPEAPGRRSPPPRK